MFGFKSGSSAIGFSCQFLRSDFLSRFAAPLLGLVIAGLVAGSASAQDHRQNAPGEFDFYVLALSWSPSFCQAASERGNSSRGIQTQCAGRPFSFVVHGLWPQYDRGFPNYCQRPSPRLDRNVMTSMLDLMPAPGLIYNEWDKHGTCSGLSARAYFETTRKARAAVKIPRRISRTGRHQISCARRHRGCFHQGQSRPLQFGHCGDLRQQASQRGAHLYEQGSAVPCLRGDRSPRLPPRQGGDATGARGISAGYFRRAMS